MLKTTFIYYDRGILSLYTGFIYWYDVVKEAWLQFLSGRFVPTKFDNDDYKRQALNYCIYRFKGLLKEDIYNISKNMTKN